MKLEELILDDTATIKQAIEILERVRCKVVYIVRNGKLCGSVSDGDVRRYAMKDMRADAFAMEIANHEPLAFYEKDIHRIEAFFKTSEIYSIPVINYNREILAVYFRNGRVVEKRGMIECPLIINAGGKGTRLYPYTKILPKALIPIGEYPITEMILKAFHTYGCKKFGMIVNHKKDMIKAYYNGMKGEYDIRFFDEERFLGTGGGLSLTKGFTDGDFFFSNCDIFIDADYGQILNFHRANSNDITIIAAEYQRVIPYGVIDKTENDDFIRMREKPSEMYSINTGLYILNSRLLDIVPENVEITLPEIIISAKDSGYKIGVYTVAEPAFMDMGQIEELEKMQNKLFGGE